MHAIGDLMLLILSHLLGLSEMESPQGHWLALGTGYPYQDGHGSFGELSGNGYARQQVGFSAVPGSATQDYSVVNSGGAVFPTATADWPTLGGMALFDAESGGRMLFGAGLGLTILKDQWLTVLPRTFQFYAAVPIGLPQGNSLMAMICNHLFLRQKMPFNSPAYVLLDDPDHSPGYQPALAALSVVQQGQFFVARNGSNIIFATATGTWNYGGLALLGSTFLGPLHGLPQPIHAGDDATIYAGNLKVDMSI